MAPAFSKDAILQGTVDHLCLVCESYLRSERDVCEHVFSADHKQNLAGTNYVDKYSQDRIRKVKKWYYCEFCNVLVSTITKVRLHVENTQHKINVSLQRIAIVDGVILSGNVEISEEAWHGFIDENTCIICNMEFDDRDEHKNESSHIINLIQSHVSHDDNNCYRKIDDSTFHCLTCNTIVAQINTHFSDMKHKTQLMKCMKENCKQENIPGIIEIGSTDINNLNGNAGHPSQGDKMTNGKIFKDDQGVATIDKKVTDHNSNDVKINNTYTSDILDSIPEFQKQQIDINFESRTAVCRKCSVILEIDSKVIRNHIKEHEIKRKEISATQTLVEKDEKKIKDCASSPVQKNLDKVESKPKGTKQKQDMLQKLVEEHGFIYSDNKLFCQRCNKNIPSAIKNVTEHVNGESHQNASLSNKVTHLKDNENKKANVKTPNFQKVPVHHFIRSITTIKNMFSEDVVINEKLCVTVLSLTFLSMTSPGKLRCLVCDVNVMLPNMKDHLDLVRHERAMNEIPVVIHSDLEFIREIQADKFHCGFCNIVDNWEGMENHLKSTSHKESKTFARWRLAQHLPLIQQHNIQRQIQNEFLTRLMFS